MIARESEGLPDADLIIVPSNKAVRGTTLPALVERARSGAHVYVSWFAGVSSHQRGAWWPDLEPIFGARHCLRYGISDPPDDVVTMTFTTDFGGLEAGATLAFPAAGSATARAYLPLEVTTADVIAADQDGRPAITRRRIGSGAIYLGAYPIEYYGAARVNANEDDCVWRLYGALADEAGIRPAVQISSSRVFADHAVHADGTQYTWLVSTSPDPLTVSPQLSGSGRLVDVLTGQETTQACELPAFGVRVLRHVRP